MVVFSERDADYTEMTSAAENLVSDRVCTQIMSR
jgi:hypothetical protein